MHRRLKPRPVLLPLCFLFLLSVPEPISAQGGVRTQSIELRPGWNAIFVEVDPDLPDMDAVFGGIPVGSVWGWFPPVGQIDFLDDPAQGLLNLEGWRGWFPRPRPESVLSNVFAIEANRAYLVELGGNTPVNLNITGRPLNLDLDWVPDSFNLVGFQVDPAAPPTFGSFLAPSSAHAGQPIYRLDPTGEWQQLPSPFSAQIRSGEAYWIYTQGNSAFQGPLEVVTGAYDGLEYSAALDQQRLTIRNRGLVDTQMRVRTLASPTAIPFLERSVNATGAILWNDLPADSTYSALAGQDLFVQLGVRRADLTADRSEQLLEITDGLGSRRLVFTGVTRVQPAGPLPLASGREQARTHAITGANPFAGLWIGEVSVSKVSESQTAGTVPSPVGEAFRFRILMHVDAGGQARLLKEVTQMWNQGTTKPDPQNPSRQVVDVPGRYVWLTDPSLIPNYRGAALRDGVPVGLRLSTIAYDFPENDLPMTGAFDPAGQLEITLPLPADGPTNPYKHRYHPDQDNLDAEFLNPQIEAFEVTRTLTLQFSPIHPAGRPSPGWGSNRVGGTYLESVDGLHRNTIYGEGIFFLTRVAATAQLNG